MKARFRASAFLQNSLALISGTVVTQGIVFLFSPFLSRIFGPADFGNLANYTAWVTVLALMSSLRYEHAIFVADGDEHAHGVIALTSILTIVSVFVYVLLAGIIAYVRPVGSYLEHIRGIVLFIPLGVLCVCWSSLLTQLNIRTGHFRRLAIVGALQVVLTVVPQIALGVLKTQNALIIGTIAGFILSGTVLSVLSLDRTLCQRVFRRVRLPHLTATARHFSNFPRYTLPADAMNVVAQQFIPVFVLALFDPVLAGLYSFSLRVVRVPLIVVATAVAGALRKEAADRRRDGTLGTLFTRTVRTLFLLAILPFLIMLLYSHQIFSLLFGDKWTDAGRVVQILSPGILFEFVAFPLTVMFLVTNTQRYSFRIQVAGFLALLAALVLGKHFLNDFMATCYLVSGVMVVVNVAIIMLAAKASRDDMAALSSQRDAQSLTP